MAKGEGIAEKTVVYAGRVEPLYGYILPISKHYFAYKYINTDEVIISWNVYDSEGGWLSRTLKLLSSTKPYTFNGHCAPKEFWKTFKNLNLNEIEKE